MISDAQLRGMAERLVEVDGVAGVTLGGSRARGTHTPASDVDLGIYYDAPLDVAAVGRLAADLAGPSAGVTGIGEWGPLVNGGGWLTIENWPVDWLYRDLQQVQQSWSDARAGRLEFHFQVGHPFGVPNFAYAGELALAIVLADPSGTITELQRHLRRFPESLREAMVNRLWEASFLLTNARKATKRGDSTYVAVCVSRVVLLCAYALLGNARTWVVNEKGAVALAGQLSGAPPEFDARCSALLGHLGNTPAALEATLDSADELVGQTAAACQSAG